MITLKDDTLTFAFPEIDARLHELVEQHIAKVLPSILEEFGTNLHNVVTRDFRWALTQKKDEIVENAKTVTAKQIEDAVRTKCLSAAGINGRKPVGSCELEFQRTLRIPDDGKLYPLPAGLGSFPLRHVDDFAESVPESWSKRGGVLMPMYQSEALWINFSSNYPIAIQIGAGKINAVNGEQWTGQLQCNPQNYLVLPDQPWLDGFSVEKGVIRQFVAVPLQSGFTVESQVAGKAETGGVQIQAFPIKADAYFEKDLAEKMPKALSDILSELLGMNSRFYYSVSVERLRSVPCAEAAMGLGAGGRMKQEIYEDSHAFEDWDTTQSSRCFVHLCNSLTWREVTGSNPPHPPFTRKEYKQAKIPWFDHYRDDLAALPGSSILSKVKSVFTLGKETGVQLIPDNTSANPELIVQTGNNRRPDTVREFLSDF